jgi:hypothetical protein
MATNTTHLFLSFTFFPFAFETRIAWSWLSNNHNKKNKLNTITYTYPMESFVPQVYHFHLDVVYHAHIAMLWHNCFLSTINVLLVPCNVHQYRSILQNRCQALYKPMVVSPKGVNVLFVHHAGLPLHHRHLSYHSLDNIRQDHSILPLHQPKRMIVEADIVVVSILRWKIYNVSFVTQPRDCSLHRSQLVDLLRRILGCIVVTDQW